MRKQGQVGKWRRRSGFLLVYVIALTASAEEPALAEADLAARSAFESAPADPRAVTVKGCGDGRADDSDAIQQALDQAAEHGGGVVFLPSGRYRISRTILVWPAVRVFGIGPTRPVLVLGINTPGFQHGVGSMVVVAFNGSR
jgi:hypothetical protein